MKRLAYLFTAQLILSAAACSLFAAEEQEDSQAQAIKDIEAAVKSYIKAFDESDAKKAASFFTQNATIFSACGRKTKGRESIEKEFANHFKLFPDQKLKPEQESVRFIRPDVAMVHGVSKVEPAPPGPTPNITYSALLVKEDGRWLMDHIRETMTFSTSNCDKLSGLEWLVGRWTYGDGSETIRSADVTCRWSENKNYLIRTYVIQLANNKKLSGTQRIGWDPLAQSVCSWLFTSDGNFEKGFWTKDGERWSVESRGFLKDGAKTAATNIITPVDDDTFTFESTNRSLDGQTEPNLGPIEIKRQQPQK